MGTPSTDSITSTVHRSVGDGGEVRTSDISFNSSIYEMPVSSETKLNGSISMPNGTILVPHHGPQNGGIVFPRDPYNEDMYSSGSGLIANEIYPSPLEPIAEEGPSGVSTDNYSVNTDSTFTTQTTDSQSAADKSARPYSLEDTKNERVKRRPPKVNYPLFKSDDTGNLKNYLDDRRVSV